MTTVPVTGAVTTSEGATASFNTSYQVASKPVITSVTLSPSSPVPGQTVTVTVFATGPLNDTLSYTCFVNGVAAIATATPGVFTFVA
jgi:hypothetical protein